MVDLFAVLIELLMQYATADAEKAADREFVTGLDVETFGDRYVLTAHGRILWTAVAIEGGEKGELWACLTARHEGSLVRNSAVLALAAAHEAHARIAARVAP